jgi:AcrR family transcriptional regulator
MTSREIIRKAAYEIFAVKGFSEATTENIARAAGLQKQSLYSHYSSKNELFVDVVREQEAYIVSEIDEAIAALKDMPTELMLKGIFEKFVDVFRDTKRLLFWKRIYIDLADPAFADILKNMELSFEKRLARSLYQVAADKNIEVGGDRFEDFLAFWFLAIQGYQDWLILDINGAGRFAAIWPFLWNGIKPCLEIKS